MTRIFHCAIFEVEFHAHPAGLFHLSQCQALHVCTIALSVPWWDSFRITEQKSSRAWLGFYSFVAMANV
jgi:hypothetical protein